MEYIIGKMKYDGVCECVDTCDAFARYITEHIYINNWFFI